MDTSRRQFLMTSAVTGLASLGATSDPAASRLPLRRRQDALKILILGGTRFLGPALVDAAQIRGHDVTLFNRGRSNPRLFPDIEKLVGDRDPDVGAGLRTLEGRRWDAVVDTSGYVPRHVRASGQLLADVLSQYVFISTISVYANPGAHGIAEAAPLATMADESIEEVNDQSYGPLKALCERAAEAALPGRTTTIRPGLIVGPRDPTYRFTYWPDRISRGGEVLAPGDGRDAVQYIDVRDMAAYCIHNLEQKNKGIFNAVGPECRLSMAEMLHGCRAVTSSCLNFNWVDAEFLREQGVVEWTNLPVWVTEDGPGGGLSTIDNSRAIESGLTFRPFADTARDTLQWFTSLPGAGQQRQRQGPFGLSPDREAQLIEAWRTRSDG